MGVQHQTRSKNVASIADDGGRLRRQIENEGFNVQKNGGYGLEHAYSEDQTAAKIFYFLLQIAETVMQPVNRGSLLAKAFPKGFGSLKNLASALLEALRHKSLDDADLRSFDDRRLQIRLDYS